MADRSLRGMRLGASSLQSEEGVVFVERTNHTYVCTQCERDTVAVVDHSGDKAARTHWDMLMERRTIPELEELLEERLALLRSRRGENSGKLSA